MTHDQTDTRPHASLAYRCPVCRLDLRFNGTLELMEIAPLETDHAVALDSERGARVLPPPLQARRRRETH